MPIHEEIERLDRGEFIDDLWFIVRRLRDMKGKKARKYGVNDEICSAQSKLAGALGYLEGSK